jgi:hypothetical protein
MAAVGIRHLADRAFDGGEQLRGMASGFGHGLGEQRDMMCFLSRQLVWNTV